MESKQPNKPSVTMPAMRMASPPEDALRFVTDIVARGGILADRQPFPAGVYLEITSSGPDGTLARTAVVLSPDQAATLIAEVESAAKAALYVAPPDDEQQRVSDSNGSRHR